MGRWQPDARGRLAEAALALFLERGYEQTTVADIAARAGLTERTFFRHFGDKREVLFGGSQHLEDLLVRGVAEAPPGTEPLDAVVAAFEGAGDVFDREHARRRRDVVAGTPVLQERELIKLATLATALAGALRGRGVAEPGATLVAEAGVSVFKVGFELWVSGADEPPFPQVLRELLATMRSVTAPAG